MARVTPAELEGNAVQASLLARVLARRPEIFKAFGRLDAAARRELQPEGERLAALHA
jgi:hypothetical protein